MLICKLNMSLEANLKPPFLPAPHWPAACLWNKSTEEVRKQTAVESILQPCLSLAEGVPTASQLLPSLEWTSKRSEMTITLLRGLSMMGACGARGSTKLGDWIVLIIKGGVSRNKWKKNQIKTIFWNPNIKIVILVQKSCCLCQNPRGLQRQNAELFTFFIEKKNSQCKFLFNSVPRDSRNSLSHFLEPPFFKYLITHAQPPDRWYERTVETLNTLGKTFVESIMIIHGLFVAPSIQDVYQILVLFYNLRYPLESH